MRRFGLVILLGLFSMTWNAFCGNTAAEQRFLSVRGTDIVAPNGKPYHIKGTNLGNWLNPEGYMFGFSRAASPSEINRMFCQMVGPEFTANFWKKFKDNYITRDDIRFIASTGSNTIRLPFNYKSFTDEDYMGLTSAQDGFARIDSVVGWCREFGLHLILDMHDAPGGQTGDNIDDSYGYPWLFFSEGCQNQFCSIWKLIARHYADEPVVLGYELLNEPIATYFTDKEEINKHLLPLYQRATEEIRAIDANHIILWGGAQWNSAFAPLSADKYPANVMFTCHRYGGEATKAAIGDFIAFRDKTGLPMYMGELGHNTDKWMSDFVSVLDGNNIGWTFWPYKKIENSSFVGFGAPENWKLVKDFSEAPRGTFGEVRNARPDQTLARKAMCDLLDSVCFRNCTIQTNYIKAIGLKTK
jgi:endoglucanase